MANGKYDQYVTVMPRHEERDHFIGKVNHVFMFDNVENPLNKMWYSIYECFAPGTGHGLGQTWEIPSMNQTVTESAHTHPADEVHLFFGTDYNNPDELGGEVELWLGTGDEAQQFILTKKTAVYVPAGVAHAPFYYRKVTHPPFFHVAILQMAEIEATQTGWLPPGFPPAPSSNK
jgi:hypothetical protein